MSVNITIAQGLQGLVATNDGKAGIIMTGATEGSVTTGTPFLVNNMTDVTTAGLTATNNAFAINQLQQIYNELAQFGIASAPLWVQLAASTVKIHNMVDKTIAGNAVNLINAAGGTIRLLAAISNDPLVYSGPATITNGLNADVYTALTNAQALAVAMSTAQTPIRVLIGGTSFSGTASQLTAQTNKPYVRCIVGDTASGTGAAVGLLLGRYMGVPVQRKASRVKDGPVSSSTAFMNTTAANTFTAQSTITAAGFITFQTIYGLSGYYFTTDIACTSTTDTYYNSPVGRVVDKAQLICYAVGVREIDGEVPVTTAGLIDPGFAKHLESALTGSLNVNMTALGNITGVTAQVPTNQNVGSTGTVAATVTINFLGYLMTFNITLN